MNIYSTGQYLGISDATTSSSWLTTGYVTGEETGFIVNYNNDEDNENESGAVVTTTPKGTLIKKRYPNRFPKKKKGDLSRANDPSKRLTLLKPTIVYQYIKERFKPLERKNLEKRFNLICEILHNAQATKQIALIDKIKDKFDPFIREQEIISCGINTYINEKTLEAFVKATTNKIIKITPIKNYIRIIPKRVQKKLDEIQKKNLFDSYVIVHTDPNDTSVEKTKAEKKDPILFGLIKGSNKYYFIADWVDELCNLTMTQIIDTLDLEKEDFTLPEEVNKSFIDMLLE